MTALPARSSFGLASMIVLFGLLIVTLAVWAPAKLSAPEPATSPPTAAWVPITLGMAMMLADYSDREDWTGCETRGTAPLYVRCPDGYTLEIK